MTSCEIEAPTFEQPAALRAARAAVAGLLTLLLASTLVWPNSGHAAIQHVQSNSYSPHSDQSTIPVTYGYPQLAGSLNVVIVAFNNSTSNVQSVTDTKGNTYTLAVGPTVLADFGKQYIYYAKNIVAAGGGQNTVTVVLDALTPYPDVRIAEYSGINTSNPFDAGVGSTGAASGLITNSGSLTTTNANDLLVAGNFVEYHSVDAGANYTMRLVSWDGHILEDRIASATGTYDATATVNAPGRWIMQLAAFKGAGGGDTQAPTTPTNLSSTAVSSTQINLSWTASTDNVGVTGYLVERCQDTSCSNFAEIATPTTTTYNDTGRTASTTYRYRVRARDAVPNYSAYSGIASASTPAAPDTQAPTTPTNLSATAASSTQINLSWTASTDNVGVTNYLVERCQDASCSNFAQVATPATASYNDTGRSPSTTYRYQVRAQDAVPNFSTYSTIASVTTSAAGDTEAPTAPSGLTAGAISSRKVNLSWTASTDNVGVTGYRVERCTGAACSNFSQIGTPATTSYSDTGLSTSTTYRYRVRAADAADNPSGYSGVVAVTTHANGGSSTTTYTYDAAGRLIRAVSSTGRTIEYDYDANGNITVIERQ